MTARRILISRFDWLQSPAASLSSGVWAQPRENMLDLRPQVVVEAFTNADQSSTTFDFDLGYVRTISFFAFFNLHVSWAALISVKAGIDPTFASNNYSALVSGRPIDTIPGTNDAWGVYSFCGKMRDDEWAAVGQDRAFIPSSPISCRYGRVQFRDTACSAPVKFGIFGAYQAWEPPHNFSYGWSPTVIDDGSVDRVPFGAAHITKRGVRRRLNLGLGAIDEDEYWMRASGLINVAGQTTPLVVVPFPESAPPRIPEQSMIYGTISAASAITNEFFGIYKLPLQVDQL